MNIIKMGVLGYECRLRSGNTLHSESLNEYERNLKKITLKSSWYKYSPKEQEDNDASSSIRSKKKQTACHR